MEEFNNGRIENLFSDLNEETQQRVLKFYGIADPKEGNFDSDIVPLFILECPDEEDVIWDTEATSC